MENKGIKKQILITGRFNSRGIIKGLAMRGQPLINFYVMSPFEAVKTRAVSLGFESEGERVSGVISTFMILKILRDNKGGYFKNKTLKDAQACMNTLTMLRNQLTGKEDEVKGIQEMILPGIIKDKNNKIIEELLIPYLKGLEKMGYQDSVGFIRQVAGKSFDTGEEGIEVIHFKEDPLSPLMEAALKNVYKGCTFTEISLFEFLKTAAFEGGQERELFSAYGSFNGFREVWDRIVKKNEPYDTFFLGAPSYDKYARYCLEEPDFPVYYGRGTPSYEIQDDAVNVRREDVKKAGFTEEEIEGLLREILASLKGMRKPPAVADEGRVYLGSIDDLPFIYTKNVYLLGLETYSGGTREHPLILDDDILLIRNKVANTDLKTSYELTKERGDFLINVLNRLIEENRNITISYGTYNTATLKAQARPSVLSRIEKDFKEQDVVGFFEPHLLPLTQEELFSTKFRQKYYTMANPPNNAPSSKIGGLGRLNLSVSSADLLIQCPYRFLMEKLLKISRVEEEKDIITWLDPKETGSLCHEIIAGYHLANIKGRAKEEKEEIMEKLAEERIEEKLKEIPPLIDPGYEISAIKALLKKYVSLKSQTDHREIIAVEKNLSELEVLKDRLFTWGKLDFAEEDKDGRVYIGDIKTGKTVSQVGNKTETFIQALIYCMAYEEQGDDGRVSEGRYLYPKIEREYSIEYNEDVRGEVKKLFEERLLSIETGYEIKRKEKKQCDYCPFETICKAERRLRIMESMIKEDFLGDI